jgi:hypothetical protein
MLIGNTVRVLMEFRTFNGQLDNPTDIIFKDYDQNGKSIGEPVALSEVNRIEPGKYFYDYTIPVKKKKKNTKAYIVLEVSGILEGSSIVGRTKIDVEWVKT